MDACAALAAAVERACQAAGLEAESFTVHRHRRVPANDGGISLGQAMVAGTLLRR